MIFRSPHQAVEIPPLSVVDFVMSRARERGSRAALVDAVTGRQVTYASLIDEVARASAGLARLGLAKGDVCAIFSPNDVNYVIAVLAALSLGAIVTTANPLYTVDELASQLRDAHTRFLFASPAVQAVALEAARLAGVDRVIAFGEIAGATPFDELLTATEPAPDVAIDPNAIVVMPYSSGTTGLPKGVMLSHRNLIANILQVDHLRDGEDTLICFLPFFHIYGLVVVMLLGLWRGATLVVMPRFDLDQYVTLIERHRATLLHLVPPVALALAKHPALEGRDFSSVRKIFSGAAPLGSAVIESCTTRLCCDFQQGYGLTEASPATHTTVDDKALDGSVGVPLASTECCIVDIASGRRLGAGEGDGELWVRGPQVMLGYFNRPEATRQTIDDEGWLHTGDIARADERGHFHIVDRLKELIKYKGMQIAPAELEGLLVSHPAVADAAVIPVPDDEAGEIPKAFVVLKAGTTTEELMSYVAARVASFKKIRRMEIVDQIPKSPSGKILRRVLRDRERAAAQGT